MNTLLVVEDEKLIRQGIVAMIRRSSVPVEEILASPRAAAIREGFSRRRPAEELCRRCGYAARF